jgi:hypothetical protein
MEHDARRAALEVSRAKDGKRPKMPPGWQMVVFWKGRRMGVVMDVRSSTIRYRNGHEVDSGVPICEFMDLRPERVGP